MQSKPDKEATGQISVRFPPDQYAEIAAICAEENRKAANVVKVLVKEALDRRRLKASRSPH